MPQALAQSSILFRRRIGAILVTAKPLVTAEMNPSHIIRHPAARLSRHLSPLSR
jgi:hypothetical protein